MKKRNFIAIVLVTIMIFTQTVYAIEPTFDEDYFNTMLEFIKNKYYKEVTEEQLIEGALKGMFETMDDYTTYYDKDESETVMSNLNGNYKGIGVEIIQVPEGVEILTIFQQSPAEFAGMKVGDKIVSANGVNLGGKTVTESASFIKGEEGTNVVLGVLRNGSSNIIEITVTRGAIKIINVSWRITNGVGYIKLDNFNGSAANYFVQALNEMDANNIRKIVVDVRNNPGGDVNQAVNISKKVVPKGVITTLDFKEEGTTDIQYTSTNVNPKYIVAVLVNENSASASEIFAGAVQDSEQGFLVGKNTFGKGIFQNLYPILTTEAYHRYSKELDDQLVNGYDLIINHGIYPEDDEISGWCKITTGYYHTRNGTIIDGTGLQPDSEIENHTIINDVSVNNLEFLTESRILRLNDESVDIYNLEKMLKLMGYGVDSPDMKFDNKSFSALKRFQREYKLSADGVIGNNTRKAINNKIDNLWLEYDKQFAKAKELLDLFN